MFEPVVQFNKLPPLMLLILVASKPAREHSASVPLLSEIRLHKILSTQCHLNEVASFFSGLSNLMALDQLCIFLLICHRLRSHLAVSLLQYLHQLCIVLLVCHRLLCYHIVSLLIDFTRKMSNEKQKTFYAHAC